MSSNQVQLNTQSLLKVPFQTYEKDFTFIVNGNEFKTSRLVSDLLSTTICQNHLSDPTLNTFTINTKNAGDFSHILKLTEFNTVAITEDELPFFIEVIEILKPASINSDLNQPDTELTADNVFGLIESHSKYREFYEKQLGAEISFVSSHLYELLETKENDLKKVGSLNLSLILSDDQIQLKSEDQLLKFCSDAYEADRDFGFVFEFVKFENVTKDVMKHFTEIFDVCDMTEKTWAGLCNRLNEKEAGDANRYTEVKVEFPATNTFKGIINHLMQKSSGQIEKEINITASSYHCNADYCHPRNVALFDDQTKFFCTEDREGSWICFDFKNHQVFMTGYTIKSSVNSYAKTHQPKSWVIEGSNDDKVWTTIDEERGCDYFKGTDTQKIHTFMINSKNNQKFRYIRMKQTDVDWNGSCYHFFIDSFEIYGNLI